MLFNTSRNYLVFNIRATCCYTRVSLILLTTNLLINGSISMMCECIPHVILPGSYHVTHHWVAHQSTYPILNPLKVVVKQLQNKWMNYWIKESSAPLSSWFSKKSSSKTLRQNLEDEYPCIEQLRVKCCSLSCWYTQLLQNKWMYVDVTQHKPHDALWKKKMGEHGSSSTRLLIFVLLFWKIEHFHIHIWLRSFYTI